MSYFQKLKKFIDESPTSLFCADSLEQSLKRSGYTCFDFNPHTPIPKGDKIYVRHGGLIAAFCLPQELIKARYLLAHTDSPCLKLKPKPILKISNLNFLVSEPYGSPLLSSYMGKKLKLAGHVAVDTPKGIQVLPIHLKETFLIPDPAIYLSKEANASLDKGKIHALISYDEEISLEQLLGVHEKILSHDLYLVSEEGLSEMGSKKKILVGPRLDNLSSCFAMMETLETLEPLEDTLTACLFFDHEEIGSETLEGAKSHFIRKRLKKIIESYAPSRMLDINSQAFSLDVAHANHPSYRDKFDEEHPILLGNGVVIKHHSAHKYAQDLELFGYAQKYLLKAQVFTMRNEIGTGSTLGPYFASQFSIPTQDIGLPLLGMHSTSEIIAEEDLKNLVEFSKRFLHGK